MIVWARAFLFVALLAPLAVSAAEVAVPPLKSRVTDLTGTLSANDAAQLEQKLAAFEAKKGSQLAVLIIPTTQPETIEEYSIRVVDQWKLGRNKIDDGVLLLIGVQELGQGPQDFSKEQKQDLMHIAICTILQASGFYSHDGLDDEGWPHFTQLKALPELFLNDQENFLKDHVLLYFQTQGFI